MCRKSLGQNQSANSMEMNIQKTASKNQSSAVISYLSPFFPPIPKRVIRS